MSVIVYRDNMMAADTGNFEGNISLPWAKKLATGPDGTLYGVCGLSAPCDTFLRWVNDGCSGDAPVPVLDRNGDDIFRALISRPNGELRCLTAHGEEVYDGAPYMAIGSGDGIALGAMFAGASASTAVRAAIEHHTHVSGTVSVVIRPKVVA